MIENIEILSIYKIVLSLPFDGSQYIKANIKKVEIKNEIMFQLERFTKTQAFHTNFKIDELDKYLSMAIDREFKDIQIFTDGYVYGFRKTSKGKLLTNKNPNREHAFVSVSHNKEKKYLIEEGQIVPPLIDLNVMTETGKITSAHQDKFRQINKFLEIIDSVIKNDPKDELTIVDFGCGKSYLTFIVYYYFTVLKKKRVKMIGMDLKEAVIDKCNQIRDKYGYSNLSFLKGDISNYKADGTIDMIITLHACDVATDYALYHAIRLKARYILSVPCCQHELNMQLKKQSIPLISNYGILKERYCALLTDSIRASLLEYFGYKTQVMEFVDFDSSPKNLLIKAILTDGYSNKTALDDVRKTLEELRLNQTLYNLLMKE